MVPWPSGGQRAGVGHAGDKPLAARGDCGRFARVSCVERCERARGWARFVGRPIRWRAREWWWRWHRVTRRSDRDSRCGNDRRTDPAGLHGRIHRRSVALAASEPGPHRRRCPQPNVGNGGHLLSRHEPRLLAHSSFTNQTYLSTGGNAIVQQFGPDRWTIGWEDWTDFNFNDVVMVVCYQGPTAGCPLPPEATFGAGVSGNGAYPQATQQEPVNTATGNYISQATDARLPGRGLGFTFKLSERTTR